MIGILRDAARSRRCVFVAGLPGTGKSLLVQRLAGVAADARRAVHLLQWDVARLRFDTPDVLARYPEVGGATHAAIRLAMGRWAREAVLRWHEARPDPRHILVGETPLVGNRLVELAKVRDDRPEPLLASEATVFIVPVPSREVRRVIESARASEMADPRHERDAASAPPHLVRWHWEELERTAAALGVSGPGPRGEYDPDLYAAVYRRLLRHRHAIVLPVGATVAVEGSAHEPPPLASELVPAPEEVDREIAAVARRADADIEREAADWYRVEKT